MLFVSSSHHKRSSQTLRRHLSSSYHRARASIRIIVNYNCSACPALLGTVPCASMRAHLSARAPQTVMTDRHHILWALTNAWDNNKPKRSSCQPKQQVAQVFGSRGAAIFSVLSAQFLSNSALGLGYINTPGEEAQTKAGSYRRTRRELGHRQDKLIEQTEALCSGVVCASRVRV